MARREDRRSFADIERLENRSMHQPGAAGMVAVFHVAQISVRSSLIHSDTYVEFPGSETVVTDQCAPPQPGLTPHQRPSSTTPTGWKVAAGVLGAISLVTITAIAMSRRDQPRTTVRLEVPAADGRDDADAAIPEQCLAEWTMLQTAQEAYAANNAVYAGSQSALISSGLLHEETADYHVLPDGDIAPAPNGACDPNAQP
ncbi:MAG: hypothetical protein ABI949_04775 [Ilumatobacteraceae bacterium]